MWILYERDNNLNLKSSAFCALLSQKESLVRGISGQIIRPYDIIMDEPNITKDEKAHS